MKQYVLYHTHKWGTDTFHFRSAYDWESLTDPSVFLAEKLGINFEPEKEEEIEFEEVPYCENPEITGP